MGATISISTLVFRPPRPTYLKPTRYFFLDVDQDNPLSVSSSLSCVTTSGVACAQTNVSASQSGQSPPPTGGRHRIPAFIIKRRDAKITILYSHGNAEDLGMMHERIKNMSRELNVNIMCYEYSGYSYATGSPSEEMCYRNIEAAYSYLRYFYEGQKSFMPSIMIDQGSSYTLTEPFIASSLSSLPSLGAPAATLLPSADRETDHPNASLKKVPSISVAICSHVPETSSC